MKVLVTGGTGHLGRAIVARLREDGHAVRILREGRAMRKAWSGARATWRPARESARP
jgi:uncharacterized protein YbjT (DUF2867 family)